MTNDTAHERKEQLYQELQELGKNISAAINELKERRDKRNAFTASAHEQKNTRKDLSKIIKDKITEVKDFRSQRGEKKQTLERGPHPGKLREEIAQIERKIETSAMEFSAEQKLTKILKEKKAVLGKIVGDIDLDRHIRSLSKEIDKLKRDSDVAHEAVTTAAKESQEQHEVMLTLSKKVEVWKKREAEAKEEYLKLKEQLYTPELPTKKTKKKQVPSGPSLDEQAILKEKVAEVEQKVKDKKKLTNEDLLAFQAQK